MSLEDLFKRTLKDRKDSWPSHDSLPGVHLDLTDPHCARVVVDGRSIPVRRHDVEAGNLGQSFGQSFFIGLCTSEAQAQPGGTRFSYEDAKRLATKVARKAERLPAVQAWLVHGC